MDNPKTLSDLQAEDNETRKKWLADRRQGVGASETAGVLGVSPWASPLSVYADKIGAPRDDPDDETKERMRWGHLLEGVVLDELSVRTGLKIRRAPQHRVTKHSDYPSVPMLCTPDAYVIEESSSRLCQVKTTSARNHNEWADGVPLHVEVQAQSEMAVCDREKNIVVALIGGQKLVWYEIERHQKFIENLEPEITKFWYDYVIPRILPPSDGSPATVRALERIHPDDSGAEVVLPEKAIAIDEELADIKSDLKKINERKKELESEIKAMIGSNTWGRLPNGGGRFSWKTIERMAYYVESTKFRQLRRGK
jgi:putative phage-type endonuclease